MSGTNEKRIPPHITEDDVRLICEIAVPSVTNPLLAQIEELKVECARLAGIIDEARNFDGMQTVNGVTDEGWMSPDEWTLGKIDEILAQATK